MQNDILHEFKRITCDSNGWNHDHEQLGWLKMDKMVNRIARQSKDDESGQKECDTIWGDCRWHQK